MKKAICIILTMVMFLLVSCDTTILTSIQTDTPNVTDTPTAPEPTVDLKSIMYTINVSSNPSMIKSDDVILDHNGNKVTVVREDYENDVWFRYSKVRESNPPEKKTFEFNGKEYELNYVETICHRMVENEKLYIRHYEFSDDIVQIKAEFVEKRLISFSYLLKNNEEKGNFTVEEAKKKSEEYLTSLYYYGVRLDKYILTDVSEKNGNLSLSYDRSDTGEVLYIDFDSMGRIIKFKIKSDEFFVPQDLALFDEKVQNAKNALKSAIQEKYVVDESYESFLINTDTGKIILETLIYSKNKPDELFQEETVYSVYINID